MLRALLPDDRQRLFLSCLSLIGVAFILIATSKYGAGVSSDAARNLSTADSLLRGMGFVDMLGSPLVLWPPLYPLLLAGLSILTTLDTFVVAWYLNVVLYGLNIWLAGWLLYSIFRATPSYAVAGALIVLLSRSMLRIHANVASEPLFETLMVVFLLSAAAYLRDASRRSLWVMCAAAGLAALQRYLGVAFLAVAAIVILRREGRRGIVRGVLPWLAAGAPIAAWAMLHNLPISGTLFGPRELGAMLPLQNISLSLTKILWWFVPRWGVLDWLLLRPWLPLSFLAALLLPFNTRRDWLTWLRALSGEFVWPGLLFAGLYFVLLAFTVVTADHLDLTSDRYYIVLLPIVLVLIFITLDRLVRIHFARHTTRTWMILVGLLAVWLVYPLFAMQSYLRQALVQGEPTNYNIANSANFREMSAVKAAERILQEDPGSLIYTNYVNIVWFIFDHPVESLPFEDEDLPRDQRLAALERNYPTWPETPGYIIWFTPNQYHHIVAPDELESIADLSLLFEDETGQVFSLRRRGE
ncbi:MAG: hypothetical protein V1755_13665 [Chloroflexota bacterium]